MLEFRQSLTVQPSRHNFVISQDLIQYPALAGNGYPTYHTGYETIYLVDTLIDPDLKVRETCAKLNLRLIRDFSDRVFLDFKPEEYSDFMKTTLGSGTNTAKLIL